ncbi:hypothetical protein ES319_A06G135100v1 [Gossypium barbadense]|uniref:TOD1/MUCI70 glycosyltransferase-like domain-containing protein n=2 Tax=Gossypium barbadense TaxID=3634 RepID=A0A5J5VDZ2_GOSBA|nr:hypothetical protein ES319_A06G135100v1 [Gossypium barbadense]
MTGGSLGIRSGSYGSLDKQLQNSVLLPIQVPLATRSKPSKVFKEKETLVHWICKLAGRKKVGMLLLSVISAAVFVWVVYVGKGEYQDSDNVRKVNDSLPINNSGFPLIYEVQSVKIDNWTSLVASDSVEGTEVRKMPPPPPSYFLGYTLPPGHPCYTFSLPPPPADKKRTGPRPCPVCYLPVEEAIALMPKVPSFSPILKNLTYIYEENLNKDKEFGGSDFGGYPTLKQRDDSYDIRESMNVRCGFVKGSKPGRGSGFDINDDDLLKMEQCHGVVVASAIFGAFDIIQQPKNISEYSKQTICFYMFVDEETEADLKLNGGLDESKKIGVWRIVVAHNLPYTDGRRNGKIPKLLTHRLFPNARFSLWIDGKLELVVDPYQILERFLWRKNATFAISRHYKRFDVFDEAEANKAAGKYDNASINFQVNFYKKEGLTPYSEAKLPITSDVPEGCVIIREHVPMSNLFTCLWFNEVDLFTSRDQISFSTVRDKIAAKTNWTLNMFLDCERRNFVVQKYHKDVLAHMAPPTVYPPPQPLRSANKPAGKFAVEISGENIILKAPFRNILPRRGRDKRSDSRRQRKVSNEIISS